MEAAEMEKGETRERGAGGRDADEVRGTSGEEGQKRPDPRRGNRGEKADRTEERQEVCAKLPPAPPAACRSPSAHAPPAPPLPIPSKDKGRLCAAAASAGFRGRPYKHAHISARVPTNEPRRARQHACQNTF